MEWFLFASLVYSVSLIVVLWTAGAIFFDVGRASTAGAAMAIAWTALVLAAFVFWHPQWKPFVLLLTFFAVFLWWWFSQRPSHDRNWDAGFSRLPRIDIEGDTVTISNVRNTEYRTIEDRTTRYETRRYRLSQMRGVDVLILHWGSPWMSHPMTIFDFGSDGRVCISIEVRYRVGQKYSLLRSLYRQQELMYVVADERDAILRRTKCLENHDLYLYRLSVGALAARQFFLEYGNTINTLARSPRWYHGMTTNCTTSIYAQGRGHMKWDWRMLVNGALDQMMYDRGYLDQKLPFDRLKKQSRVNEIANRAPLDSFSEYLRRELPGYRLSADNGSCAGEQSRREET